MKKNKEEVALVKTTGFAVIELEDEMLESVIGGQLPTINAYCPDQNCNSGNCVAGCACPPST